MNSCGTRIFPFHCSSAGYEEEMKRGVLTFLTRLSPRYGPHYGIAAQGYVRGLGLIFVLSFWSFAAQAAPLSGGRGLIPTAPHAFLLAVCGLGVLSGLFMLYGFLPWFSTLTATASYAVLLLVAGFWLHLPGDLLLLEMAFPALLLVPVFRKTYPSLSDMSSRLTGIIWINLLLCKLLLGSGIGQLLSQDSSWKDSTALYRFFETQSLPSVPGWYLHHLPATLLEYGVWGLVFIEIMLPMYVLFPRTYRNILAGGATLVSIILLVTGHQGFLPLQIILLAFTLVDDVSWRLVLPAQYGPRASTTFYHPPLGSKAFLAVLIPILLFQSLVFYPLPGERFLASFRLSNRYMLFREVPDRRMELSLQGSMDGKQWIEYRFHMKPTDPRSLPNMSILHHPRFDQRFVELGSLVASDAGSPVQPPLWLLNLITKLFDGDPIVQTLFPVNPFPAQPPRFLRLVAYEYRFADPVTRRENGVWWIREPKGLYGPVFSRENPRPRSSGPPGV